MAFAVLKNQGGFTPLMKALYGFLADMKQHTDLCMKFEATTAMHGDGKRFELYRIFKCERETIDHLQFSVDVLPTWEKACLWDFEGGKWEKLERDINARMTKNKKLQPILTRGVTWKNRPFLIHAYKFSTDPFMKLELQLPDSQLAAPEFALHTIAMGLELHEFLLPEIVAKAESPYVRHEAKFLTLREYLSRRLPEDLYNLCCFPPSRLDDAS